MEFKKYLLHYRRLSSHHIQELWSNVHKNGVKADYLRDMLMFYLQHRVYPPVVQKSFDSLVMKLMDQQATKKMKNVIIQIISEIVHCLAPNAVIDGIFMYGSSSMNIDLLNCLLVNPVLPKLENRIIERVISLLQESKLNVVSIEDRCRALVFLTTTCPPDLCEKLNQQIIEWLQYSQSKSTSQIFFRSDLTELDGSPPASLTTVLSQSSNMTTDHVMSVLVFSQIRQWLLSCSSRSRVREDLLVVVFSHCSVLVEQSLRKTTVHEDILLQVAVRREVLDILHTIVEIRPSLYKDALIIVKQLETLNDSHLQIRIWKFYMCFDKYGCADRVSEKYMQDLISKSISNGTKCYEIASLLVEKSDVLRPLFIKYHSNLFKMFAMHPHALLEEYLELIEYLTCDEDFIVEIFHRIVDLPVQSATICVSQTPALTQAGYSDPTLVKANETSQTAGFKECSDHFMLAGSSSDQTSQLIHLYPDYFALLQNLANQGLVQTCSQAVPLLLDNFLLTALRSHASAEKLLPVMLRRMALIFEVPGYKEQIQTLFWNHFKTMFDTYIDLINHESVLQFISNVKNMELSTSVYMCLVTAVGNYTKKPELLSEHFEIVECSLWEMLTNKKMHEPAIDHMSQMVTALAKLSCRSQDLLPRALLSLNRVISQASTMRAAELTKLNQLASLLKNPNIASVVLAPSSETDETMAVMLKAVSLFMES
ncbi:hypothetical protein LSTR_LSTR014549 [Laodelphax striatellus]|uniref:Uncharacterized protein n=1 Tax=Laodelphax striatellus TaxID=195883 RepID=A0A482WPP8_LAOST|nr:hypothetical protein LSTR_LSTR014549 [Laodelphax striatellus]